MNAKEIAEEWSGYTGKFHPKEVKLAQAYLDLQAKLKNPTEEMIKVGIDEILFPVYSQAEFKYKASLIFKAMATKAQEEE